MSTNLENFIWCIDRSSCLFIPSPVRKLSLSAPFIIKVMPWLKCLCKKGGELWASKLQTKRLVVERIGANICLHKLSWYFYMFSEENIFLNPNSLANVYILLNLDYQHSWKRIYYKHEVILWFLWCLIAISHWVCKKQRHFILPDSPFQIF